MHGSFESRPRLPEVPVIELGHAGLPALWEMERARGEALLAEGRRRYGRLGIGLGDGWSRRWLARAANPYGAEIAAVARAVGRPGVHLLNLSHEWACTGGVADDPAGGVRFRRVLDWPFDGLGRHVVVARLEGPAGPWLAVTWPGFVGVLTGLAPRRFAAAFNQAPLRRRTGLAAGDWLLDRAGVWRSRGLPPAHLLRRVFEQCRSYAEARAMLAEAPLCLPALFLLAGAGPGEGCVIERTERAAALHDSPVAVANHWLGQGFGRGRPRGGDSAARQALMLSALAAASPGFAWLAPPILNGCTRLAVEANPATGALAVQGWERDGPATAPLFLEAA